MKKIAISLSLIVAVVAVVGGATFAFFTDTETSSNNTFAAGTLEIEVNDNNSSGTFNFEPAIALSNMAPGEVTDPITIEVKNDGSLNAAVFGRFTGGTGDLAPALEIYSYKVDYFNANGTPTDRWNGGTDPYFGEDSNEDWFIKDGVVHASFVAAGGSNTLDAWINGNGALDIPGIPDDMEGLKPDESYVITFQIAMDEDAGNGFQGKTAELGYQVRATQINEGALLSLGLGGNFAAAIASHLDYLQTQVQ